jgi:hypothetical protein
MEIFGRVVNQMGILAPRLPRGRAWIEIRYHAVEWERGIMEHFLFVTTESTTPDIH